MDGFRFDVQTSVYYGRNALQDHQDVFDGFGKKAVIVTSQFIEGYKNIGLEDAKALFDAKGIEYKVLDYTIPNPPVENIEQMYEDTKDFDFDFVVGIGGGSSLDAAKALAQLTDWRKDDPERSAEDIFFGYGKPYDNYKNMCRIPVITMPTTAGTGSECSCSIQESLMLLLTVLKARSARRIISMQLPI